MRKGIIGSLVGTLAGLWLYVAAADVPERTAVRDAAHPEGIAFLGDLSQIN